MVDTENFQPPRFSEASVSPATPETGVHPVTRPSRRENRAATQRRKLGWGIPSLKVKPQPVTSSQSKSRKGGRNLVAATGVGAGLLAAYGLTLFLVKPLFAALCVVTIVACLIEFRHAIRFTDRHLGMPIVVIGGIGIYICAWQVGLEAMLTATLLTMAAALLWQLAGPYRGEDALKNVTLSTLTVAYIPFLGSFLALLAVECGAPATAVFVLSVTLGSDTGGYLCGRFLGRHHMSPSISPRKTWEGFAGSVLFAVTVSVAGTFWMGIPWFYGIILGVLMAVVGTIGDLSESLMKRELGIKDMGHLLPGHGGLLDRMDSILMAAPVAYIVLKFAIFSQQGPVLS
ncbi:phosphatidate cytidylyltransferase [Mobiluncus curtisii]|uniref:Phosphatidate cytidylyltransferase n=1 Tax=Mobiluncus curtisii TaxID=2051 RepID=A0A7Y0UI28_9ACTO|nr:phosphatidate cytidylyltransferase [Mobiluncus curtisii]MCU9987706.1 phosphatidate cytidylyltransferase [Mobiluncus curtisii]MCV0000612.1 phosphatidate cytidylyltransferase [Mobiluncus curtisii]NMW48436.1 phosphatidate cytidylyltransferase [Mobiluncus curtisii]NMW87532.1 phosphatidate cytidylyltransferase [Mobiluncus curtisii]NMX13292.1 phosphatidate cytidylyltransferase [Mobiluncus curtisii]